MVIQRGDSWQNKKNQAIYTVLDPSSINSTNEQAGQVMVILVRAAEIANPLAQTYVRARAEFLEKFEKIQTTNEYFTHGPIVRQHGADAPAHQEG